MNVERQYPPNYEEICATLDIRERKGIVFTYGDTIYAPDLEGTIVDHLMCHEQTHEKQQALTSPKDWWKRYLSDRDFRFEQELAAYRAQYKELANHSREYRRQVLGIIAKDLAGAMYGNLVSKEKAKVLIMEAGNDQS